jgi:site-specific DNA-methyltransferase (adenine-specific)
MNRLFYGDNLEVLRRHVRAETVDLVYLDPPFKSGKDYNIIFGSGGKKAAAQVQAFDDTWHWGLEAEDAFRSVIESRAAPAVSTALTSLRKMLGESDMMAYLCMMAPRLVELRRVLKASGSLYLHCDSTASHYLKVLLDAVFGDGSFRNEVVWRYRRWPAPSK